MNIHTLLTPSQVVLNCNASSSEGILSEILEKLKLLSKISNVNFVLKRLLEREKLGSTSIGHNSAVPHTKLPELKEAVIGIGISKKGIIYHPDDQEPVHFLIVILSPSTAPIIHLQILAAAAALIKKSDRFIPEITTSCNEHDIINIIKKFETTDD